MKKLKLILIFQIMIYTYAIAQNITVSGQFRNKEHLPLDFITVSLFNKDNLLLLYQMTAEDGNFQFSIEPNKFYKLNATLLGNQLYKTEFIAYENLDLGSIELDNSILLTEVVVDSRKKNLEKKIDRLKFNVESTSLSYGGDALDVLKKTPNLSVQGDELSFIGKSSMRLLINNKVINLSGIDLVNYLKTISSDKIKYIEVITNPPAKYEVEGNSGLINIVLKKSDSNAWNNSARLLYNQSSYTSGRILNNWDYNNRNLSFYNNLSYGNGSYKINEDMSTYAEKVNLLQSSESRQKYGDLSIKSGLNYRFKRNLISLDYIYINNNPHTNERNDLLIRNIKGNDTDSIVYSKGDDDIKTKIHSANLNSTLKFDTIGKELYMELDYLKYKKNSGRNFGSNINPNEVLLNEHNQNNQNIDNISFKADLTIPLLWSLFEFGGKLSKTKSKNKSLYFNEASGNNFFSYKEQNEAIYVNLSKSFNDKIETKIGLRGEFSQTEGYSYSNNQKNKNNYFELFPSFYFLYKINENNSISFTYGRRINRPPYNYLDPFRWVTDSYTYTEGNPFLKPSFTNNIEFSYVHSNFYNSLYYSDVLKGFGQITVLEDEITRKTIFDNYFKSHQIGYIGSYTYSKLTWLNSVNSVYLAYINSKSISDITDYRISGFNKDLSTVNDIFFDKNKNFILNLSYWVYFKGLADLRRYSTMGQFDISFKMLFLDKKLQFSFSGEDLFKSNYPLYTRYTNSTKVTYHNYYDSKRFVFSLTYKLGQKINQKIKKKNFGVEEEERRISY